MLARRTRYRGTGWGEQGNTWCLRRAVFSYCAGCSRGGLGYMTPQKITPNKRQARQRHANQHEVSGNVMRTTRHRRCGDGGGASGRRQVAQIDVEVIAPRTALSRRSHPCGRPRARTPGPRRPAPRPRSSDRCAKRRRRRRQRSWTARRRAAPRSRARRCPRCKSYRGRTGSCSNCRRRQSRSSARPSRHR